MPCVSSHHGLLASGTGQHSLAIDRARIIPSTIITAGVSVNCNVHVCVSVCACASMCLFLLPAARPLVMGTCRRVDDTTTRLSWRCPREFSGRSVRVIGLGSALMSV